VKASVYYHVAGTNPNGKEAPLTVLSSDGYNTKPDGSFYLTVWPGQGVIDVRADAADRYATVDVEKLLTGLRVRSRPTGPVHALIPIDADAAKPAALTFTVDLKPATSRKGRVVGPNGRSLTGVTGAGLEAGGPPTALATADFTLTGPRAGTSRLLIFIHKEKKFGAVWPISGDSTGPLTVELAPLGSAAGRVSRANETVAGLLVTAIPNIPDAKRFENLPTDTLKFQGTYGMQRGPWRSWTTRTTKTAADGKFKLDGLLPGLTYTIHVSDGELGEAGTLVATKRGVTVEAGKELDLGELKR
jgi:hypothetical protein